MKRDKSSSNDEDEEVSRSKNSDGDVKRSRMAANNSSSSNLRRSSRISQRTEKTGSSSTDDLNDCDASISVDNSMGQRNESNAPEVLDGTRSRVITEVLFSQSFQEGSSASNPVSAQPSPTLQTLPKSVQEKLMTYLDIDSLQSLSETCLFYDKYINGQFHLSIKFLFDKEFLLELQSSKTIVKKHVLRLTINDLNKFFASNGGMELLVSDEQFRYLIRSQLKLIHTDKLREINYLLKSYQDPLIHSWNWDVNSKAIKKFSPWVLHELFAMKSLRNVTRFSTILGLPMHPVELRTLLPNLEELSVLVSEPTEGYSPQMLKKYQEDLKQIFSYAWSPVLNIDVLSEPKTKRLPKVLNNTNGCVEKLIITAPCTFNACLKMENLKEVEVHMRPPDANGDCCSFFRVKPDDRQLHRPGFCVVNLGAIYDNCPKLEKFMGHDLGALPLTNKDGSRVTFSLWKSRLKKVFYEDYTRQGGTKDMKSWTKSRWSIKKTGKLEISSAQYNQ